MIEAVNQNFKELMRKKLSKKSDTKAVAGWFYEDLEAVVTYGDFGLKNTENTSFQIGSVIIIPVLDEVMKHQISGLVVHSGGRNHRRIIYSLPRSQDTDV